jgi:hypothetical protein
MKSEVKDILIELAVMAGVIALAWAAALVLAATPNILLQPSDAKYFGIVGVGVMLPPLSRKVINMAVK